MSYDLLLAGNKSSLITPDMSSNAVVAQVTQFRRDVDKLIATMKVKCPADYKYVMAVNRLSGRELNQLKPFWVPESVLMLFQDREVFYDNNFITDSEIRVVSPKAFLWIDDGADPVAKVEELFDSFGSDDNFLSGLMKVYIYINIPSPVEYLQVVESLKDYDDCEIISDINLDHAANLQIHTLLPTRFLDSLPVDTIMDFKDDLLRFQEVGKTFFIESDKPYGKNFSVGDLMALMLYSEVEFDSSVRTAELLSDYFAELYFTFSPSYQTFVEWLTDLFQAPSCLAVNSLTPFIGTIRKITLRISAVDTQTNKTHTFDVERSQGFSEPDEDFDSLLKRDVRNLRTHLMKYKDVVYRVNSYNVDLSVDAYIPGLTTRQACDITYSRSVKVLGDFFGGRNYQKLVARSKNFRQTRVPDKFILYLARKLGLSSKDVAAVAPEDLDFWQQHNTSLSNTLTELLKLVTIEQLIENGDFSAMTGLKSPRIVLRIDRLGAAYPYDNEN